MEHAPLYRYSQSLGHEGQQSVPTESALSMLVGHAGGTGRVKSGGERGGAGLPNIRLSFLFHLDGCVTLCGDER